MWLTCGIKYGLTPSDRDDALRPPVGSLRGRTGTGSNRRSTQHRFVRRWREINTSS